MPTTTGPGELDLHLLRSFLLVVEWGSFTAAASALGITQPALSQQVRRLESLVGYPLLCRGGRGGRGLAPTPAGQELVDAGRVVLAGAERALTRARAAATGPVEMRVGFVPGTPQVLLSLILAAGDGGWGPVVLRRLEWAGEAEALLNGRCDLAVVQLPLAHPALEIAPLLEQNRVAVFRADHPLAGRRSLRIEELADEPILDAASDRRFWLVDPRPGGTAPRVVGPPATTVEEMLASVAAGRGMALTSHGVAEAHWRRDLRFVPVEDLAPLMVGVAWPADAGPREVRSLVDELRRGLAAGVSPGVRPLDVAPATVH